MTRRLTAQDDVPNGRIPVARRLSTDARSLQLRQLLPNGIHLRSQRRFGVGAEPQVMPVGADRFFALTGNRSQTSLLAKLRREVRVVLRPRVRPPSCRRKSTARVSDLLEQARSDQVAERRTSN